MDIERVIAVNAGVVSAAQLIAAGMPSREIRRLHLHGWRRPRHGWYACPDADRNVESPVKNGGVLACTSVLARHGVWVPDRGVHLRTVGRKPAKRDCRPYGSNPPALTSIDSLRVAASSAVSCLDPEGVVVVLDSMLNQGLIEAADATTFVRHSRYAHLRLDARCDATSESGIETMTRLRLQAKRIAVRTQVTIGDIGRVDLLVGRRLILECDGAEHHAHRFQEDRSRDRALIALGFLVQRLTYDDVVLNWPATVQDILAVIRRRDHEHPAAFDV